VWGGNDDCWHVWGDEQKPAGYRSSENRNTDGLASEAIQRRDQWQGSNFCQLCGAWRGQLGLEPTPELYVEHLVDVFREVKRVLRDDGVLWLNLGDSYAGSNCGSNDYRETTGLGAKPTDRYKGQRPGTPAGLKPKDLVGIPWRVALALQAAGWYLRSDVIWAKGLSFCESYAGSCMPESVTDRPTSAHEHLFLLAKAPRYYYDNEAVKEAAVGKYDPDFVPKKRDWRTAGWPTDASGKAQRTGNPVQATNPQAPASGRNLRNVWAINPAGFPGAHYAVMPPALAEVCIKAGSAEGDTILDPFGGAGTTGLVADRLGRDAVLIELKADNCEMAEQRIKDDAGMWGTIERYNVSESLASDAGDMVYYS